MKTRSFGLTQDFEVARLAREKIDPIGFEIQCHESSEDFDSLQRMTKQGIDTHLTAIFFEEFEGGYGRRGFRFDPDSLGVLCRRLAESDKESDWDLRSSILYCLGIEEV